MSRPQRLLALALTFVLASGASAALANAARRHPQPRYHAAEAGLAFGLSLMRRLPSGNLVLSPDSIEAALAMTGLGAAGRTAQQMASVLRLTSPQAFDEVGRLQQELTDEQAGGPTLSIAAGLFVQEGFALDAPFTAGLEQAFGATPQPVDFAHDPAAAIEAVNRWASLQTHGLIPRILETASPETVLDLANAIYLKANWEHPFKGTDTSDERFADGAKSASTPFMHQTEQVPYSTGRGYALVELPYAASSLSLAIVLPTHRSVTSLLSGLTAPVLRRMLAGARPRNVKMSIPKFEVSAHLELAAQLQALGMTAAFGPAGLTRIAAQPLALGKVLHAADIDVYEEGTEAAAVTVAEVVATAVERPLPAVRFTANHPFLFFLCDRHSGAVLFEGRVEDPSMG